MRLSESKIPVSFRTNGRLARRARGHRTPGIPGNGGRRDRIEELEEEVERVLGQYRSQIDSQNMDIEVLRQKIKRQLAREKGIVL